MQEEHRHHVLAWWTSGGSGIARSDSALSAIHFAAPPEFGGLEARWTPEDLLLCAVASCFTVTFYAIARRAKFEYVDLGVEVEAVVCRADSGYTFSEIVLRTSLEISREQTRERALELLQKARALCLVSRALAVSQKFETRVEVSERLPLDSSEREHS